MHAHTDGRTKVRTEAWTNGCTLDGPNAMPIAHWPLASGANKKHLNAGILTSFNKQIKRQA